MSKKWLIAALLVFVTGLIPIASVKAGQPAIRGVPGSGEFAYGAGLTPDGLYVNEALEMAGNLPLDWLAVEFPWDRYIPEPGAAPDWSRLDSVISAASEHRISVLLSIHSAPDWAMTAQGPSPAETAALVDTLVARYGNALRAVELFPAANTVQGWRAAPDPQAYTAVLAAVSERLAASGTGLVLVGAGLQPSMDPNASDDLVFLDGLYAAGISNWTQIISLQLDTLTGDPAFAPSAQEHRVLRHYEEVRRVMLDHGRDSDLVWITRLEAPTGQEYRDPKAQSDWPVQAYTQLRSQLYIGAAFYSHINPAPDIDNGEPSDRALVLSIDCYHLFYNMLRELIAQNAPQTTTSLRGRPKDGSLIKSRP